MSSVILTLTEELSYYTWRWELASEECSQSVLGFKVNLDGSTSFWQLVHLGMAKWRKLSAEKLMLLNCGVGEDSWESLGFQGNPTSPS